MSSTNATDFSDCTDRCKSTQHGDIITAAISKRSILDIDLCSYLNYICTSCESVRDTDGRTALHVAASCGRINLVRWLVKNRHANINEKDKESGYTALHRSIFYGQIDVAVELVKLGANIFQLDSDNLTMLDHAMKDGKKPDTSITEGEIYVWGSNTNNLLGPQQARSTPELLDGFHKEYPHESVHKICLDQFHSVILTKSGKAYSCGHGQGGRLGLGDIQTVVTPKVINFPDTSQGEVVICVEASISRDHSIFLSSDETVFSCGLNTHCVLGLTPPPHQILVPRPLKHFSQVIQSVCAARFHSVAWGPKALYTWGLNAGQLGHKINGPIEDKYIKTPKKVSMINVNETTIKAVAVCDGATAVCSEKGDIYVLHEYQCRKIASRQLNVVQISIIGGKLNASLDRELSNEVNRELKVVALTNVGNLLLWQESDPQLCRCIFSINRAIVIKQVAININEILFVTKDGEAFQGLIKPRKKKANLNVVDKNNEKSAFHKFLEREDCINIKLTKFPRIHRAISIFSDTKGKDYGVIQECPYKCFGDIHTAESEMQSQFEILLERAEEDDEIHDVIFKIGNQSFPAHKFVISGKSPYFEKMFFDLENDKIIILKGVNPDIFEQFLLFIYTGSCDLIKCGKLTSAKLRALCDKQIGDNNEKGEAEVVEMGNKNISAFEHYSKRKNSTPVVNLAKNPVRMLHEMAKKFACSELQVALSNLDMHKYEIRSKTLKDYKIKSLRFDRTKLTDLYDVTIKCRDGKECKAHKCILAARLEYFNNMFSMRWSGANTSEITLPFPRSIAEALLEFLYTDTLSYLNNKELDHLLKVLILADQLFVTRLKQQCESLLTNVLTLKNVVQLLSFSHLYNAEILKFCCMSYIIYNITPLLELHVLEELEDDLLKELSEFYFREKKEVECRVITPYSTAALDEEVISIGTTYPVSLDEEVMEKITPKTSQKRRSRTHKTSTSDHNNLNKNDTSFDSVIQFPDILEVIPDLKPNLEVSSRLKSITLAQEKIKDDDFDQPQFTKLTSARNLNILDLSSSLNDSVGDFPELNSPLISGSSRYSKSSIKSESKHKMVKISQKERKRLSSESNSQNAAVFSESPKNPWKAIPTVASPSASLENNFTINDIILDEKKQKENLVKITTKQLVHTQIEDRAIVELNKFYNCDDISDEIIVIERVAIGAVASPVWVPRSKT